MLTVLYLVLLRVFQFDEERRPELQPTTHPFLRFTACQPGQLGRSLPQMNFWVKKQGAHPHRSKVKARTGLQQRGSCFSSRQREESKAQPQHFIYQTSLSHIKLHFCRVCISLPRSQGWKHPSEKCPRRQREAQRYFSITGGVSRLQHNLPLLSLLP